jgi:hypothetical protein
MLNQNIGDIGATRDYVNKLDDTKICLLSSLGRDVKIGNELVGVCGYYGIVLD